MSSPQVHLQLIVVAHGEVDDEYKGGRRQHRLLEYVLHRCVRLEELQGQHLTPMYLTMSEPLRNITLKPQIPFGGITMKWGCL